MFDRFRHTISLLRKEIPPAFPVNVRRVKLNGLDGYCMKAGEKFLICINKDLDDRMSVETLLHEWAHALRWDYRMDKMNEEEFNRRVHDAAWGTYYAEVYSVFESDIIKENEKK
jgi:hypothetical protein